MENLNAVFINDGMEQPLRLLKLNEIAIKQMTILENLDNSSLFESEKTNALPPKL